MHVWTMRRSDRKVTKYPRSRNRLLVHGIKRSTADIEAMRRADAKAEKALKFARVLEERRGAIRASATPMDELEESAMNDEAEKSVQAMMLAAAVLTETRETVEAFTVAALQQAHAMSHRADATADSFFQAHIDVTVTTQEQARKKQLDFVESMKVYKEVYADDIPAGWKR